MPLVEQVTKKLVPDEKGGWYWYKPPNGKWTPTWVDPANENGWPASVELFTHSTDVKDAPGEWGSQIIPPEAETLKQKISWTMMLPVDSRIRGTHKHSSPHGNANKLDLSLSFGKKGEEYKFWKHVNFSVNISDSGEAVFSLESQK